MYTPGRLAAELHSDFGPGGPTKRTLFPDYSDDEDSGLGMEEVGLILLLCYEYFFSCKRFYSAVADPEILK
jgi:hypothetical protein